MSTAEGKQQAMEVTPPMIPRYSALTGFRRRAFLMLGVAVAAVSSTGTVMAGPAPVVSSISVATGPFTGGTTTVLTGSGFTGAAAVKFGGVNAASYTVNSDTQITTMSPCEAPAGSVCPESALNTVPASTVDITVTNSGGVTSAASFPDHFIYGEGDFGSAAVCSTCQNDNAGVAVGLGNGKVLRTVTAGDTYGDGVTVRGSTTFTSGTASTHQRSFTAADVGKRLQAFLEPDFAITAAFPQGTTIQTFVNANTVAVTKAAIASGSALSFAVSRNDSELYNPSTNTWAATGSCPACGQFSGPADGGLPTLTLLNNGKVLEAGGADPTYASTQDGGDSLKDAFLYDPAVGTWSATASMVNARTGHTATLLTNGNVLVAGGNTTGYPSLTLVPLPTAELYNPTAGTWSVTGPMAAARSHAGAALIPGGKVLVTGGYTVGTLSGSPGMASAEVYNPALGIWLSAGTMAATRVDHAVVALPATGTCGSNCGKVLVVGGRCNYAGCLPVVPGVVNSAITAELYTPSTNSWALTGAPSVAHNNPVAALLSNGRVLVSDLFAERYDAAAASWKSAGLEGVGSSAVVLPAGPTSACGTNCGQVLMTPALYNPRPVVGSVAPNTGAAAGGTVVTVTGTGLASVTAVNFGATAGTALAHDATNPDTKLTVTSPAGTGSVDLTAISSGGRSAVTCADLFGYAGPPSCLMRPSGRGGPTG